MHANNDKLLHLSCAGTCGLGRSSGAASESATRCQQNAAALGGLKTARESSAATGAQIKMWRALQMWRVFQTEGVPVMQVIDIWGKDSITDFTELSAWPRILSSYHTDYCV